MAAALILERAVTAVIGAHGRLRCGLAVYTDLAHAMVYGCGASRDSSLGVPSECNSVFRAPWSSQDLVETLPARLVSRFKLLWA